MGSFGPFEIGLILPVVPVIFGANRLSEIGAAMGKSVKGFKKSISEPGEIDVTPNHRKEKS